MSNDLKLKKFIPPNMDPQKLQHFLAVYEHSNFGRAAQSTGVTQQAVSKSISRLEDMLGLPLFERGAHGAEPTIYAHTLARRAKIIMAESKLAAAELQALRGSQEGFVQVGFGWTFMQRIAPDAIERFRQRRPGVGLRVFGGSSAELFPKLLKGEMDFVVSAPPEEFTIDPALETEQLFLDRDALVMRRDHPLAAQSHLDLEDLARCTWLVSLSLTGRWQAICNAFGAKGIEPPSDIIDMDSLSLAKSMVARGDYICVLSEELVIPEIASGDFKGYKLDELHLTRPAVFVRRRSSPLQPAAGLLASVIRDVCQNYYPQ